MSTPIKNGALLVALFLLFFTITPVSAQPDQTIYYQYCVAQPDTSCFQPTEGTVDSVGRDVAALGGNFRFCLQLDTIDSGYAPVRVILVLDKSGSMCSNPGGQCCADGDGSGNCMMNDPTDQRIAAAHIFVDSLRAISPESEIGVVSYAQNASNHQPRQLNTANNVATIHNWIEEAACSPTRSIGKVAKTTATYLGLGLEAGLRLVDTDFNNIDPIMARHVILLTDGAWDDLEQRSPDSLIAGYKTSFPDRKVPTVHGVFLSDSLLHVTHGYPWQGCSTTDSVNLSHLEHAAALTGGMYFPGSTPQNIINNFLVLLDSVTQTVPQQLVGLTVTNTTNSQTSSNSARPTQIGNATATWQASLANLPLVTGRNDLAIKAMVYSPGNSDTLVLTTNVVIIRSDRYREAIDTDLFNEFCSLVSARLTITASPESKKPNEPFDVKATISNASNFQLDSTQIRIFTRFPDSESGVIATFHLDGNLTNATGGVKGEGTPTFNTGTQLFGTGAITGGSFTYALSQLTSDFVMEEWIFPGGNNAAAVLFSGNGVEVGVNADMNLYFKSGSTEIVTAKVPIDKGVWSHIGVVRAGGSIQLFVNGIAVSEPVAYTAAVPGGAITISVPNRWVVDEVRFTNKNRLINEAGNPTLPIPTIPSINWTLAGVNSKGEMLKVPAAAWSNGTQLELQFSSEVPGRVLVNIRQNNAGSVGSGWSKNSNPVKVTADGPSVKLGVLTVGPIATGSMDTLVITFTQPVKCAALKNGNTPKDVFLVSRNSKDTAGLLTGSKFVDDAACPETYIGRVTLLVQPGIDPNRDSIRLTKPTVTDEAGNPAEITKKGDIEWGKGSEIQITAFPTEAQSNLKIDEAIVKALDIKEEYGKVIRVISRRDLKPVGFDEVKRDSTYGTATIYDPVGNLVRNDLDIFESRLLRNYYVVWDGSNRTKRRVGSGAYLVIFKFQYADGTQAIEKKKIAIRW